MMIAMKGLPGDQQRLERDDHLEDAEPMEDHYRREDVKPVVLGEQPHLEEDDRLEDEYPH